MASCPYVTSVGATALAEDAKRGDKEGWFNRAGRAYPDIAIYGQSFPVS